jgi:two-component system cell cycle sensor histidine kinase/response regulator CckA
MPRRPIHTVLLVDDHELVRDALRMCLEKERYKVIEAAGGEEAVLVAERFPETIHVLVTDLVMAKMNGRELARRLLAQRPQLQVVIISGFPDEIMDQREWIPQIPILQKPFPPDRLVAAIEGLLANPRSEQTVASLSFQIPNPKRVKNPGV